MKDSVVWLDSEVAHIFGLKPTGVEKSNLKNTHAHHESEKFYHELAQLLLPFDQVLLVGPGLSKSHFQKHLQTHHHATLMKKIVGVESCDHPTDGEILALARKFFTKFDVFNNPI